MKKHKSVIVMTEQIVEYSLKKSVIIEPFGLNCKTSCAEGLTTVMYERLTILWTEHLASFVDETFDL